MSTKILQANDQDAIEKTTTVKKHWKQMQGQLWATKAKWVDYVVVNFNTKKVVIIRILPDPEFHKYLELAVQETLVTEPFTLDEVHDIVGEIPDWSRGAALQPSNQDSKPITGGW